MCNSPLSHLPGYKNNIINIDVANVCKLCDKFQPNLFCCLWATHSDPEGLVLALQSKIITSGAGVLLDVTQK